MLLSKCLGRYLSLGIDCIKNTSSNGCHYSPNLNRDVQIIQRWKIKTFFRNICVCTKNTSLSLGTCSYAQIIQRWKARIIFRNICVHTQNTSMSQGAWLCAQRIQRWKAKIIVRKICIRTQNTSMCRNDPNNK